MDIEAVERLTGMLGNPIFVQWLAQKFGTSEDAAKFQFETAAANPEGRAMLEGMIKDFRTLYQGGQPRYPILGKKRVIRSFQEKQQALLQSRYQPQKIVSPITNPQLGTLQYKGYVRPQYAGQGFELDVSGIVDGLDKVWVSTEPKLPTEYKGTKTSLASIVGNALSGNIDIESALGRNDQITQMLAQNNADNWFVGKGGVHFDDSGMSRKAWAKGILKQAGKDPKVDKFWYSRVLNHPLLNYVAAYGKFIAAGNRLGKWSRATDEKVAKFYSEKDPALKMKSKIKRIINKIKYGKYKSANTIMTNMQAGQKKFTDSLARKLQERDAIYNKIGGDQLAEYLPQFG